MALLPDQHCFCLRIQTSGKNSSEHSERMQREELFEKLIDEL